MGTFADNIYGVIFSAYFIGWAVWIFQFTEQHNKIIKAFILEHDPKGELIGPSAWEAGGFLTRNTFYFNRKHPRATHELIQRWDMVYGKFWRLLWFYMACWLLGGGLLMYSIRTVLGI
jgi:hypothetical protein